MILNLVSAFFNRNLLLPDGVPAERPKARIVVKIYKAEGLPKSRPAIRFSVSNHIFTLMQYVPPSEIRHLADQSLIITTTKIFNSIIFITFFTIYKYTSHYCFKLTKNSDKLIKANYTKYASLINTTKNLDFEYNIYIIY